MNIKKEGGIPVHVGADPAEIPMTDELVTWIVPVKTVDAVKLKTDLSSLIGPTADFSSNAMSNTLIITDTAANIHRMVEIVASLDKKDASESLIRVKQLKYADATAAAKLINDMFNPQGQNGQQSQQNNPFSFSRMRWARAAAVPVETAGLTGPGGGEAEPAPDSGQLGKVLASADSALNAVVYSGQSDTVKLIDQVLTELDANPAEDQSFFLYAVQNGQAVDIAATLNALFSNSGTGTTNRNTTSANNRTSSSSSNTFGGSSAFGGGSSGGSGGSLGGNRTSSSSTSGGGTGQPHHPGQNSFSGGGLSAGATATAAALMGQVYVVADADTNSLLVATATKYQDRVKEILKELDRPVPQVLIKALIAEVTHDNSSDFGVDY